MHGSRVYLSSILKKINLQFLPVKTLWMVFIRMFTQADDRDAVRLLAHLRTV